MSSDDETMLVVRLRIQQYERTAIGDGYLFGEAADEIERLRGLLREVLEVHRPQWVNRHAPGFTPVPQRGRDPVGCVDCYPEDGSWPCVTAMIARNAIDTP